MSIASSFSMLVRVLFDFKSINFFNLLWSFNTKAAFSMSIFPFSSEANLFNKFTTSFESSSFAIDVSAPCLLIWIATSEGIFNFVTILSRIPYFFKIAIPVKKNVAAAPSPASMLFISSVVTASHWITWEINLFISIYIFFNARNIFRNLVFQNSIFLITHPKQFIHMKYIV